jgi:hypothetical protein
MQGGFLIKNKGTQQHRIPLPKATKAISEK